MQKPKNYDNTSAYGESLELGGHVLKIIKVEEAVSKANNPMIVIYLDTDKSDKQPSFFKKRYDNDTRNEKKWGCIVHQLVNDIKTGDCNQGLVTFHEAVQKSNKDFQLIWGDKYCECFNGKLVGGIFRREEYINNDKKAVFSTKCFRFKSVDEIKKGVKIPADKLLKESERPKNPLVMADPTDFDIPPLPDNAPPDFGETDNDYPF